jgi:hypothetical protein
MKHAPDFTRIALSWGSRSVALGWGCIRWLVRGALLVLLLMVLGNVVFSSQRDVPYRAFDSASDCRSEADRGWDVLAQVGQRPAGWVANDEWAVIDTMGLEWRRRFACIIQRHTIPNYRPPTGETRDLAFDLAFLEVQENGKPYPLRELCTDTKEDCVDEGYGRVRTLRRTQLDAILEHLKPADPAGATGSAASHYVLVFIHGWRHDASIGDSNVAQLRHYAAHVARFLADRASTQSSAPPPRVTAVFVGWRGARTDETWLKRHAGHVGSAIGTFSALLTLFDRKPVSEAVAPSVLAGLQSIEAALALRESLDDAKALPRPQRNRMIVIGHSLGGNMLATALQQDLVKKVNRHEAGSYMLPAVGDLVVLINPASEASKWTTIQRAVWSKTPMSHAERASIKDYEASHHFFRDEQRPIIVSVTAAKDWPPGGRRKLDCELPEKREQVESAGVVSKETEYDWATYDLFPAFKGDFRPAADTLVRLATGRDPHDECDTDSLDFSKTWTSLPLVAIASLLRVMPFMQTEPELTRTIGHLDPPRIPRGRSDQYYFSAYPFGTTHELRGPEGPQSRVVRKSNQDFDHSNAKEQELAREVPVDYDEILGPKAACPPALGWLEKARNHRRDLVNHGKYATYWSSDEAEAEAPALHFLHGFRMAGVAAITRANDPFWNMRAFDTALARHDGYMLSSFICAMNQLVLDDITTFTTPSNKQQSMAP